MRLASQLGPSFRRALTHAAMGDGAAPDSGRVSGAVYGISTVGSIAGTLGTTFVLIPTIGSRAITIALGALGAVSGLALLGLSRLERRTHRN